ncbi:hypothetical protein CIHG_09075 [Coccidioides immitis H538.4]|uniref:Microbial-type PARG catalytic domain-containing protein n=1 Tax=Coccidioides immitis H538.4 TaxID=396776 RepID=A0A0J8S279_COCIT|nr:hypothetical protein CIHG_09075 [Coccidioides immitis H538.4]
MGRLKPSVVLPPQSFRKDARAKQAKAIINRSIPALLASDSRARKGVESTELIVDPPPNEHPLNRRGSKAAPDPEHAPERSNPRISIHAVDTITAALRLHAGAPSSTANGVGILNMASPLRPGGGVLNGATSQEEFLCVRTTLYPSLQESFYRLPEVGGVWTPDVLIFRDGTSEGNNLAKVEEGERSYTHPEEREVVEKKMRAVMRIFQAKRVDRVVLGAWGCGAYGNPVEEIASAWRKVLLNGSGRDTKEKETWDGIEQVVFAVNDINIGRKFAKHFGEELVVEKVVDEEVDHRTIDQNEQAIKELKSRIEGLGAQIPEARTELLRHRLQEILKGLKLQLAGRMMASGYGEQGQPGTSHQGAADSKYEVEREDTEQIETRL